MKKTRVKKSRDTIPLSQKPRIPLLCGAVLPGRRPADLTRSVLTQGLVLDAVAVRADVKALVVLTEPMVAMLALMTEPLQP